MAPSVTSTRVFEVGEREGYKTLRPLARAMGVSFQLLSAVKRGERGIGVKFIAGARRAFPDYPLDYLFPPTPAPAPAVHPPAEVA